MPHDDAFGVEIQFTMKDDRTFAMGAHFELEEDARSARRLLAASLRTLDINYGERLVDADTKLLREANAS